MPYFEISFDARLRPCFAVVDEDLGTVNYWEFWDSLLLCKSISEVPTLNFIVNGDYPEDFLPHMDTYIVSDRVRKTLTNNIPNLGAQFLPVRLVKGSTRASHSPFWLINPLVCVDALDQEKSRWPDEKWKVDNPSGFVKAVLRADIVADQHIFRLSCLGEISGRIYVSDLFRQCLADKGFTTGIQFTFVESA